MALLTADQVTQLFALPHLAPSLPSDAVPVSRVGRPEPLDYATISDILLSITSLPGAGPLTGNENVYIIQGGVPVLTTIKQLVNWPARPIGFVFPGGPPTTAQFLFGTVFPFAYTIAGNFAGAVGAILNNPTGSFVIVVKKNGANVGTVTISAGGAFTFATTAGAAISMAPGDHLDFFAPVGVDATAANIEITILATLT